MRKIRRSPRANIKERIKEARARSIYLLPNSFTMASMICAFWCYSGNGREIWHCGGHHFPFHAFRRNGRTRGSLNAHAKQFRRTV